LFRAQAAAEHRKIFHLLHCFSLKRQKEEDKMSRSGQPPDLKKYMDKQLQIKLNANRQVVGTLRGFDQFMNLVIDNTVEVNGNDKNEIGMVVIRGNSVVTIEALEPVARPQ
ncbi:hypothetical protein AABB24_030409, partial [Solanum stoloniferum]